VKLLLDEMFPKAAAAVLRDEFGHDVLHVGEAGLHGADDAVVATFARSDHRVVVTENISDYALEPDLVLVCVLKRKLPSGGVQARSLVDVLNRWVQENPDPYVGQHWPT
jgi:hypothetical protein